MKPEKLDYKYIRAWERMMASFPHYLEMQLEKARTEGAPETSIYRRDDGTWATFEDIKSENTKSRWQGLLPTWRNQRGRSDEQ